MGTKKRLAVKALFRVAACLALVRTLAGVFLATRVRAAFQALLLAAALARHGGAGQGFGGFAVGFGDDFVAHDEKLPFGVRGSMEKNRYCLLLLPLARGAKPNAGQSARHGPRRQGKRGPKNVLFAVCSGPHIQ